MVWPLAFAYPKIINHLKQTGRMKIAHGTSINTILTERWKNTSSYTMIDETSGGQ